VLGRERSLLARVKHPNLVRVFDHGRLLDGRQYLVLELIPGADLAAWLGTYGKLNPSHALSVLWQLAAAVDHLHAKGVVHSDIKPSNIMLNVLDRHVTLIDFGVAFDFATEQAQRGNSGTRGYIAPEQERGEGCGPATDRFAVAAVAQELLGLSFAPSRARKRKSVAQRGQPSNVALRAVFRRALHPRPEERYASARGFVKALARALSVESEELEQLSAATQPRGRNRSR
jgi:serine/threonine-protein kinase